MRYILFLSSLFFFSSCHVGRFVIYNFADITDHKKFPSRPLPASGKPFTFIETNTTIAPKEIEYQNKKQSFESFLEDHNTVAFLIIRNDSILYENYFNDYEKSDVVASFSMAKSVTSMLIGCAIEDGLIASVEDPITRYIPYFKDPDMSRVKIKHLLQMTSGIRFNEGYFNPFGHVAKFYYGRNLEKYCSRLKLENEPGTAFNYVSGDTQLLGMILQSVLGEKSITGYFNDRIWSQIGMEYDASWSTDKKNGTEKTFCCLNARARDFAKLGRLYLNGGNWDGKQIINKEWINISTKLDESEGSAGFYQYQWWIPNRNGAFMAQGILGQYVYVYPAKNLILVRLGKNEGKVSWWPLLNSLAENL